MWGQRGWQGPDDAPEEFNSDLTGFEVSVWHPGGGGLQWAAAHRAREEERGWSHHPLIESGGGVKTLLRRQVTRSLGRRLWGAQQVQMDRGRRSGQRRRKRRWVRPREEAKREEFAGNAGDTWDIKERSRQLGVSAGHPRNFSQWDKAREG